LPGLSRCKGGAKKEVILELERETTGPMAVIVIGALFPKTFKQDGCKGTVASSEMKRAKEKLSPIFLPSPLAQSPVPGGT
jgi:hypothetical protein